MIKQQEMKNFNEMIKWFFDQEDSQSICLTIHKSIKTDKPLYSLMSIDAALSNEKDYCYGNNLTEAMEGYAKQI